MKYAACVAVGVVLGGLAVHLFGGGELSGGSEPTDTDSVRRAQRAADEEGDQAASKSAGTAATAEIAKLLGAPPEGATREDLLVRDAALRRELTRLRSTEAAARGEERARPKILDLGPDELRQMAERCEVRFDVPHVGIEGDHMASQLPPEGISDEERTAISRASEDFHRDVVTQLRALYVEATGDEAGASALSPESIIQEIWDKVAPDDVSAARRQIARELAGLDPPRSAGSEVPVAERQLRVLMAMGDRWEDVVASVIGRERAHAIRVGHGGWGSQSAMSGCPDGD